MKSAIELFRAASSAFRPNTLSPNVQTAVTVFSVGVSSLPAVLAIGEDFKNRLPESLLTGATVRNVQDLGPGIIH